MPLKHMSLKQNIIANYLGQFYVALIGIVMVPVYIRYMGVEAYGLVGFFAILQAWFQLLDMGLTPLLIRKVARYRGGAINGTTLWGVLRTLEGVFLVVAVLGGSAIGAMSNVIANHWLNVEKLPVADVVHAIAIMGGVFALKWVSGLYRSAIIGFERYVWLNWINAILATVRIAIIIPIFIYVGTTLEIFFTYQIAEAGIELAVLVTQTYRIMVSVSGSRPHAWSLAPLRGVQRFCLTIAFSTAVFVLITQTDKLMLSKLLTLTDYAYFTLAILIAGCVNLLSDPICQALLPRLTKLIAEENDPAALVLYRRATQAVCVVCAPAVLMLAFFPEQILWVWTGNKEASHHAATVLTLYAIGNGALAVGAFPYFLQYAKGNLRLHLIANIIIITVCVPAIIWATWTFGAIGAGASWATIGIVYFVFWVPVIHSQFASGMHFSWLFEDVGIIVIMAAATAWCIATVVAWPDGRWSQMGMIVIAAGAILVAAGFGSSLVRSAIRQKWIDYHPACARKL